jgi:hypothetical protein
MKFIITITFLIISLFGFSQDSTRNWKLYPSDTDSVKVNDTLFGIKTAENEGKISVTKDKRIDAVSKQLAGGENGIKPIIHGYRIQIIASSDKSIVDKERGKFIASFRGTKSYINFKEPNYKLKIGNFRTKLDAQKFQNSIKEVFPSTLILSDNIEFPKL